VSLTLIGAIGGLVAHSIGRSDVQQPLFVLGTHGNDPWNLVVFGGILITAVGGIRWASRLGSELGGLLSAAMALMLAAVVGLAAWSGWEARTPVAAAARVTTKVVYIHDHGATLPGAAASLDGASDPTGAEGASITGHVHGTPGSVSPQEAQILSRQVAAAKEATARYRDIAVAKADGFFQVTQFIPGLGLHLANIKLSNRIFDPAHPNVLLYQPDANGKLALVGVAYSIAHTGPDDEQPAGFAGNSDVWHFHRNLCFLPTGSVTITPDLASCKSRGGYFQGKTAWLLHAWIWKTNPEGLFTEYNQKVF
jgi:hypothetical protein